jgi:hypothetical protein
LHPSKYRSPELLLALTHASRFLRAFTVALSWLNAATVTRPCKALPRTVPAAGVVVSVSAIDPSVVEDDVASP